MIDPAALAHNIFGFLLPHLDYVRGKVADGALSESGKALIGLLKDKWLAKSETAKAALDDVASDPTDPENREAVVTQLRKTLKSDPEFAREIAKLAATSDIQINVTGNHNKTVVVQGNKNSVDIR